MALQNELIFLNGDKYFDAVFQAISEAETSVDVETYILSNDSFALEVMDLLGEAQKRGVKVRVLMDAAGSAFGISQTIEELQKRGLEYRVYRPFFVLGFWQTLWNIFRFLRYFNQRNHRKTWIIDRRRVFLSSMNISKVHLKRHVGNEAWCDYGVSFEGGQELTQLHAAFEKAWKDFKVFKSISSMLIPRFSSPRKTHLSLNYKFGSRRKNHKALLRKIKNAKKSIWLANPYFTPDFSFLRSIQQSAKRGVDVRVLLPKNSDVFFMPWVSESYYFQLIESGIQIYEYLPQMFHGKIKRVDDWYQVGTSNLNRRSLFHDLEVDLELTLASNRETLKIEFERIFSIAKRIEPKDCIRPNLWHRMLRFFWGIFRYWL